MHGLELPAKSSLLLVEMSTDTRIGVAHFYARILIGYDNAILADI